MPSDILQVSTQEDYTEKDVSKRLLLTSSVDGVLLLRNNCGAFTNEAGALVRFGLGSFTSKSDFKSSDFIGITPVKITHGMVGETLGVFTAYEVKAPGFSCVLSPREKKQDNFLKLVRSLGGIGKFVT